MKIRIDIGKIKKIFLSRVVILLFFLVGTIFAVVIPFHRFLETGRKRDIYESRKSEEIGRVEVAELKFLKLRGEIDELEAANGKNIREIELRQKLPFHSMTSLKESIARMVLKNRITFISIGRASVRDMSSEEVGISEVTVPYSLSGEKDDVINFFREMNRVKKYMGLEKTSLEVIYLEEGERLDLKLRVVGRVSKLFQSEIQDKDKIQDEGKSLERDEMLRNSYDFSRKQIRREQILLNGKSYEVRIYEDGEGKVKVLQGKSLEKKQ